MVRKDSSIQAVEDLKGKIVATNGAGSPVDIALRSMLRKHDLQETRDVTMFEVQLPNMKAVLTERKADLIMQCCRSPWTPACVRSRARCSPSERLLAPRR